MERNREHLLEEILLISIAAVLSGAESWNDIAEYGEDKQEWLKTFLTLPRASRRTTPSTGYSRRWTRKRWKMVLLLGLRRSPS